MSSGGQALGGVIGAIAGFFIGGPSGAMYGAQIGMGIGGIIDPPKGPHIEGPRLSDLTTQSSTYGAVIPRLYGTSALAGNVFWLENNQLKEVATTTSSGGGGGGKGGGGGGGATTTSYSYFATFAVGLCEGPIVGIRRIWVGAKLIYDVGNASIDSIVASGQASSLFTLHLGTDTQLPDARMQATLGVANTPAYRGLAYLVLNDYPLADHGNSLMGAQVKVEVMKAQSLTGARILGPVAAPAYGASFYALQGAGGSITGLAWRQVAATKYLERTVSTPGGYDQVTNSVLISTAPGFFPSIIPGNQNIAMAVTNYSGSELAWYSADGVEFGSRISLVAPITAPIIAQQGMCWDDASQRVMVIGTGSTLFASVGLGKGSWDTVRTVADVAAAFTKIFNGGDGHVYAIAGSNLYQIDCNFNVTDGPWSFPGGWANLLCRDGNTFYFVGSSQTIGRMVFDGVNYALTSSASLTIPVTWSFYCYMGGGSFWVRTATATYFATFSALAAAGTETLGSIVSTECLSSGILTAGDIDVTALTQSVRGYRISSVAAVRAGLDQLRGAFPFDAVQAGYKIVFRPRGGASVVTVPASDLDSRGVGDSAGVSITNVREMDSVLPVRVIIKYIDVSREYDVGEQYAERLNTDAVNISTVELALVLTTTESAGIAEVLLYLYWLERYDLSFRLPPSYQQLEPADVITIVADEATYSLRLTSITYTQDGRLECMAKYASSAIYTPTATGDAGQSTGSTLALTGASIFELMDLPNLLDSSVTTGFPAAMTGNVPGWPGGVLYRSEDGGQSWVDMQAFISPGSVMGLSTAALDAGRTDLIDKSNALNVRLYQGTISSVTETAMLNGSNYFAYGADGRWEIIAAQTATLQGDGSYTLTDLLRGRFGTEWACGLHQAVDKVISLNLSSLSFITSSLNAIGLARTWRGVTIGQSLDSTFDTNFTYKGVNLECLSPVYLNGNRSPTTNDWSLDWIRRTRVGGEWRDYVNATLGETTEAYEIDIFTSNTYVTVKRTLTGLATPAATYTSAQQVTDFGSNQATLYVKVYQLSASVGRGYPLTTSITR